MKYITLIATLLVFMGTSCQTSADKKSDSQSTATEGAISTTTIVQQDSIVSESIKGKYIVVKEDREIIRDGKITESTSEILGYKTIYDFKNENLVSFFLPDYEKPIDLKIKRSGLSYHLTSENAEAEDELLMLKKHTPNEVIFVRETADRDEEGEILVRLTLYMKPI